MAECYRCGRNTTGDEKLKLFKGKLKFDKYSEKKKWNSDHKPTIRDFREKAFEDLERLTRAFECI